MAGGVPYATQENEWLISEGKRFSSADIDQNYPSHFPRRTAAALMRQRELLLADMARASLPIPKDADPVDALILERLRERTQSVDELCDALDRGPSTVRESVERLCSQGFRLRLANERVEVTDPQIAGYTPIPLDHFRDGTWFRCGVVSDTHLCNKNARLDVLNASYDHFAAEGIRQVLHGGNWIDGEARFNRTDLIVPPGFERQIRYFVDQYPQREGIVTHFIDGDDHEGWYAQREGVEIGRRCVQTAQDMGRSDLFYLGYGEADIPFRASEDSQPAILRLAHPKGGSSYALSYKPQRTIESYDGGDKPQIVLTGHYHKSGSFYWRNVHTVLTGCMERQTYFMRGKQLAAHVGFWVIEFQVHPDGSVPRFRAEWFPFFDAGYYTNRYGINDDPPVLVEDLAA